MQVSVRARLVSLCIAPLLPLGAAGAAPSFEGVWSGVFTTQDNEFWNVEDFACFAGCPAEGYEHLQKLLDDPANDSVPFEALMGQTFGWIHNSMKGKLTDAGLKIFESVTDENDPTLDCQPYGFAREVVNALPIEIRRVGRNLEIQYEEWRETRTIYLDGRSHPKKLKPTPLGHSVGHYDGDALVVDTVGLSPDIFYPFQSGGGYSEQAHGHERYTILDDPRRLVLELTVEDPVDLREPFTTVKTWLYTPDMKLVKDSCKDYPARP